METIIPYISKTDKTEAHNDIPEEGRLDNDVQETILNLNHASNTCN